MSDPPYAAADALELNGRGRIVHAGARWATLLGQPAPSLADRPFSSFLPPDAVRSSRLQLWLRLRRRRSTEPFALTLIGPTPVFVQGVAHLAYTDGGLQGVTLTLDQTSGPRSYEQHLAALAAHHADDAVIVTEAEPTHRPGPRIVYVNDALCRATGYAAHELLGQTPRLLQGPETDRAALGRIREALARWEPITEEIVNYRKDGSPFWIELSITPVADDGGYFTHWVAIQRDISKRKDVESALAERQAQYRGLVANLPGVVYRCRYDPAWTTLFMSEQAASVLGVDPVAFTDGAGMSFRDVVVQEDVPVVQAAVREAIARRGAFDVHYRVRHADGTIRWLHDRGCPWFDADGRVRFLDGVMFDVTAQHQAEERLRLLEAAVEDATESVLITETQIEAPGPRIVFVNRGFERMTGYTADEVVGQTPRLLQGPLTDAAVIDRLRRNLADGDDFFGQTVNYRKDGTPFSIEWSISAVTNPRGKTTHYVAVQRDVTERQRTEERLRLLEAAVANAHDAVVLLTSWRGAAPSVTYVNDAFHALNGYTLADVASQGIDVLAAPHETEPGLHAALGLNGTGEKGVDESRTVEARTAHRSGAAFWSEFSIAPVTTDDDDVRHWVVIQRDITHMRRFEAERRARERAEEMMRAKTSFFNNMSHEIRTPLTAILSSAEILILETEGVAREFAEMLHEGGKRLLNTLNSVLDLARLDSGDLRLAAQRVRVDERAAETIRLLRPLAERKGLSLTLRVHTPEAIALGDAASLDRVFTNLIDNAIKFTNAGSVDMSVTTTDDEVLVEVRDSGVGIGEAFLPHLFEEFKQESEGLDRSHEGTGLGLAITRRLLDAMNGRIDVETERGVGSCFTVALPRAADAGTGTGTDADADAAPHRILVLDDNRETRRILGHLLRTGWQADVVSHAAEAIEQADAVAYDALLLDIHLGDGMTGLDVLQRVRQSPRNASTPAVALTVYSGDEERRRFLAGGFDAHVTKPFHIRDLLHVLGGLVAARRAPHAPR